MKRVTQELAKRARLALFDSRCAGCGYNRCLRALHFHHLDHSEKKVWSRERASASFAEVDAHPERFTVLCANCHFEAHEAIDRARRLYRPCQRCGSTFEWQATPRSGRGQFCSRDCADRSRVERTRAAFVANFWQRVTKTDDCWLWTGYIDADGFGRFNPWRGRPMLAHRVAYELEHGSVPPGRIVMHTCTNNHCVRLAHLHVKGQLTPDGQVPARGRSTRGECAYSAKFTSAAIVAIRARYAAGGISQKALGAANGVSQATISLIVRRKSWSHLAS